MSFRRILFARNTWEFSVVVVEIRRRNKVPDEIPEIECRGIIGGGTASGIHFRNARDGTRIRRAAWHPFTGITSAIRRVRNSIFLLLKVTFITQTVRNNITALHCKIYSFTALFTRYNIISKDSNIITVYLIYIDATFGIISIIQALYLHNY